MNLGETSKSVKPSRWTTFKKWAAVALAHGWELIRRVDGKHGLYRHMEKSDGTPCGHLQVRQAPAMEKGEVRCGKCEAPLEGWAMAGKAKGWDLLRQVDRARGEFRHIHKPDGTPCGAEKVFFVSNLRNGHAPCDNCGNRKIPSMSEKRPSSRAEILVRWIAEAASRGWELTRKLKRGSCEFRHLVKPDGTPCGATLVRQIGNMRYNRVRCEACEDHLDVWVADALKHGWKFNQKVDDHSGRYCHLLTPNGAFCGATKQVDASAMRKGKVLCDKCENPMLEWVGSAVKNGWALVRPLGGGLIEYRHVEKPDGSPCGHLEKRAPRSMRVGTVRCGGCGDLQVSVLHQKVRNLLENEASLGVRFHEEVQLGLVPGLEEGDDEGTARADFLIDSTDPKIVIEIDGQQHFARVKRWQRSEGAFKRQVLRDVFVEEDGIAQGMVVLRFGSWEPFTTVEEIIAKAVLGQMVTNRLAEQIPFNGLVVHGQFWALRAEGLRNFRKRQGGLRHRLLRNE